MNHRRFVTMTAEDVYDEIDAIDHELPKFELMHDETNVKRLLRRRARLLARRDDLVQPVFDIVAAMQQCYPAGH